MVHRPVDVAQVTRDTRAGLRWLNKAMADALNLKWNVTIGEIGTLGKSGKNIINRMQSHRGKIGISLASYMDLINNMEKGIERDIEHAAYLELIDECKPILQKAKEIEEEINENLKEIEKRLKNIKVPEEISGLITSQDAEKSITIDEEDDDIESQQDDDRRQQVKDVQDSEASNQGNNSETKLTFNNEIRLVKTLNDQDGGEKIESDRSTSQGKTLTSRFENIEKHHFSNEMNEGFLYLPKLGELTFDGQISAYQSFVDAFDAMVGCKRIPNIEKLAILKRSLKGRARDKIDGLRLIHDNYEKARQILDKNYGNLDRVRQELHKQLAELCKKDDYLENVSRTFDKFETIVCQLEGFNEDINHPQIQLKLEQLLPNYILSALYDKKENNQNWTVDKSREFVREMIIKKEMINQINNKNLDAPRFKKSSVNVVEAVEPVNAVTENQPRKCFFCSEKHETKTCSLKPKEKIEILKKRKRCLICTKQNHSTEDCRFTPCKICDGKHSNRWCPNTEEQNDQETTKIHNVVDDSARQNKNNKCLENVLLWTKSIRIKIDDVEREITALFDPGSERTLISSTIIKKLSLQPVDKEELIISTVGNAENQYLNASIYKIDIKLNDGGTEEIHAAEITSALRFPQTTTDTKLTTKVHPIDILIGMRDYFRIVDLGKKLPSGFFMIESKVGPLIGGVGYVSAVISDDSKITEPVNKERNLVAAAIYDDPEKQKNDETSQLTDDSSNEIQDNEKHRDQTRWLWKDKNPPLERSEMMCRLKKLYADLQQKNIELSTILTEVEDIINSRSMNALNDEGINVSRPENVITRQATTSEGLTQSYAEVLTKMQINDEAVDHAIYQSCPLKINSSVENVDNEENAEDQQNDKPSVQIVNLKNDSEGKNDSEDSTKTLTTVDSTKTVSLEGQKSIRKSRRTGTLLKYAHLFTILFAMITSILGCPEWSSKCTTNPVKADILLKSTINDDRTRTFLQDNLPPYCSLRKLGQKCSSHGEVVNLHKIQLYDMSEHYLHDLNVVFDEEHGIQAILKNKKQEKLILPIRAYGLAQTVVFEDAQEDKPQLQSERKMGLVNHELSDCKNLKCYVCMERLIRLDCLSWHNFSESTYIVGVFGTIALIMLCLITCKIVTTMFSSLYLIYWMIKTIWLLIKGLLKFFICCIKRKKRSTRLIPKFSVVIIFCFLAAGLVQSCTELATMNAESEHCSITEDSKKTCKLYQSTRLMIKSGEAGCLLLKDDHGQPLGQIIMEIVKIQLLCEKELLFFTKPYEHEIASIRRCPRDGSCVDDYCKMVKMDQHIEELTSYENFPGYNGCYSGSEFWFNNCFLPTPSCVFYRIYANTVLDRNREVFQCSKWVKLMTLKVKLKTATTEVDNEIQLKEDEGTEINDIKLQVISINHNGMPPLKNYYVKENITTALVPVEVMNEIYLKCNGNDCVYTPQCNCGIAEDEVKCHCAASDVISQVLNENRLPLKTMEMEISEEPSIILKGNVEIQIDLQDVKIQSIIESTVCKLDVIKLSGCYNCDDGADLSVICKSGYGSPTAEISCRQAKNSVVISCNNEQQLIKMYYQSNVINDVCKIKCANTHETFEVNGKLEQKQPKLRNDMVELWSTRYHDSPPELNKDIYILVLVIIVFLFAAAVFLLSKNRD